MKTESVTEKIKTLKSIIKNADGNITDGELVALLVLSARAEMNLKKKYMKVTGL